MAKLRVGPFSEIHFSKLEQKLNAAGIAFSKSEDPAHLEIYNQKMKQRNSTHEVIYPVYSGNAPEYLFIEIEKSDVFTIKQDLNDLGISLYESEGQFSEEYYCTKCDYKADTQARCPTHNLLLINYGEWVTERNKTPRAFKVVSVLMVLILLSFLLVVFSK